MNITVLSLALLTGCSTWAPETRHEEAAFQVLHGIDALQTMKIALEPEKFQENDGAWAIGRHPHPGAVLPFFLMTGLLHVCVTDRLEENGAPLWMRRTWQVVTIGTTANAVIGNFKVVF